MTVRLSASFCLAGKIKKPPSRTIQFPLERVFKIMVVNIIIMRMEIVFHPNGGSMSELYSLSGKKIWIVGHNGMVGSAISRRLDQENCNVLTVGRDDLDLTRQSDVEDWLSSHEIDAVFLAAAKVGGIYANATYPAEFLYDNLMIAANVIHASWKQKIEKLMFLGSSCIYPRMAPQPMTEDALLTGSLEPTNEWYALAKISGIKLCQAYRQQYGCDFISAMPTNLFGPGDNFHPENSHAPAALMRRMHEAKVGGQKSVIVWGTGKPKREFLYVDDLADGLVFLMKKYSDNCHVNVGTGVAESMIDFANRLKRIVGFDGELQFDIGRPDGPPVKLMNISKINGLGWHAETALQDGLERYYTWFLENQQQIRT